MTPLTVIPTILILNALIGWIILWKTEKPETMGELTFVILFGMFAGWVLLMITICTTIANADFWSRKFRNNND